MRPIEFSFGILTLCAAIIHFLPRISKSLKYRISPLVLVLISGAQLIFEGFRWQLWPLFIASAMLIFIAIKRSTGSRWSIMVIISFVLAIISISAAIVFPIPEPFIITGPYQVGTTVVHLIDYDRHEIYGPDPNAQREIMVQIWYPADPEEDDPQVQWMPDIDAAGPAIATWIDLPPFALNHLKYVKANAFMDAPAIMDSKGFPVLIFSHGWAGFKEQNIFQVEELASHGYTVIGINHTYGAVLTVFPDGRQAPRNPNALPSEVSDEEYDLASNLLVRQWAQDISFVIDELENINQSPDDGLLLEKLDLSKMGVFGHSTGAGATVEFCASDARCKAALVMDLWAEPVSRDSITAGLSQPVMILYSENWDTLDDPENNYGLVGELVEASSNEVYEMTIQGTKHFDFSSLPLLSPLTVSLGLKGPIDGDLGLEIINFYSVNFFDRVLLNDDNINIADLSTRYPEILMGVRP
jgi:dienelactone hydrolase